MLLNIKSVLKIFVSLHLLFLFIGCSKENIINNPSYVNNKGQISELNYGYISFINLEGYSGKIFQIYLSDKSIDFEQGEPKINNQRKVLLTFHCVKPHSLTTYVPGYYPLASETDKVSIHDGTDYMVGSTATFNIEASSEENWAFDERIITWEDGSISIDIDNSNLYFTLMSNNGIVKGEFNKALQLVSPD